MTQMTITEIDEMLQSAYELKDTFDIEDDDFLEHYGRKGMKWYQHIFGDVDIRAAYHAKKSSKTDTKKKNNKTDEKQKSNSKQQKEDLEKKAKEEAAELRKKEKEREHDFSSASNLYKARNKYTDDEIAQAMKRIRLERELSDLRWDDVTRTKKRVDDVVNAMQTGIKGYNNFAMIYNRFADADKQLSLIGEKKRRQNNSGGGNGSSSGN